MPICQLTNVEMHYAERGQGEPLLFLSGLAGDHLYWLGQLRAFGRQFHCLAPDSRDSGRSSSARQPYTVQTLAADLAELHGHLKLPPAHVVGLSMGGAIAQELALAHPEMVSSLVLVCTWGRSEDWFRSLLQAFELIRRQVPDTGSFFDAVLPWWVSHRFFTDSGRVSWLRWLLRQTPNTHSLDAFLRQLDAVRQHDTLDRLSSLDCPVLILAGEDDTIAPARQSCELAERIPQAQLRVMPGVGHALPLENTGQFNSYVSEFLNSMKTPRRRSA